MTRVIHIKNSKGGSDEVYIGRAGKGHDGYFGNPVARGKKCIKCGAVHKSGGSTLSCYTAILRERLDADSEFRQRVAGLDGKTLVCFCKPNPCHGDVLARAAKWLGSQP